MPTYLGLYNWTDQGVKSVKETITRTQQARAAAERAGGHVIAAYWVQGAYDLVAIADFPDDETASAFALTLGASGNARTHTMRLFSEEEMQRILQKVP
jgi:uncharacterized protein with GYD domain